jgi:hypothetical protein
VTQYFDTSARAGLSPAGFTGFACADNAEAARRPDAAKHTAPIHAMHTHVVRARVRRRR